MERHTDTSYDVVGILTDAEYLGRHTPVTGRYLLMLNYLSGCLDFYRTLCAPTLLTTSMLNYFSEIPPTKISAESQRISTKPAPLESGTPHLSNGAGLLKIRCDSAEILVGGIPEK